MDEKKVAILCVGAFLVGSVGTGLVSYKIGVEAGRVQMVDEIATKAKTTATDIYHKLKK